jgi:hypothetical protein
MKSLSLLSLSLVGALLCTACADESASDDVEVELADGKTDGLVLPFGKFQIDQPLSSSFRELFLKTDRSYEASFLAPSCNLGGPCPPSTSKGTYRLTRIRSLLFITFTATSGRELGRFGYDYDDSTGQLAMINNDLVEMHRVCSGEIDLNLTYRPSPTEPFECPLTSGVCVTGDQGACPQLSPLPPDFCADGEIVSTPGYITGINGEKCELPSVHCVTRDRTACPQLSQLPPDFCEGGEVLPGEPTFIPSADGKECRMPSVHCVSDEAICPLN